MGDDDDDMNLLAKMFKIFFKNKVVAKVEKRKMKNQNVMNGRVLVIQEMNICIKEKENKMKRKKR